MSILDRLFGRMDPPPEEVTDLETATENLRESLGALSEKLAKDPCAADPTREECSPEIRRELRRLPDVSSTLLGSRDWR